MATIKKTAAVALTVLMMSGALAVSALATPDEWMPEKGPYLAPAVMEGEAVGRGAEKTVSTGRYVVRRGDTLLAIAVRLGVAAKELASMNNLDDADLIRDGQVLVVPGSIYIHTVLPGETLSGIAKNSGLPVKDIADANGLDNKDLLMAGQKLVIARNTGSPGALPAGAISRGLPVGELDWPVVGWISSPFGMRDGRPHEGVDIAVDHGTPIRAAMPGRVSFAGPRGSYGLAVIIDHGDGVSTLYAHASKILVSDGQWVSRGDIIALVGNTGMSRGPHLHLELQLNGVPFDPILCLRRLPA